MIIIVDAVFFAEMYTTNELRLYVFETDVIRDMDNGDSVRVDFSLKEIM